MQLPGCGSLLMTVSLIITVQWDIGNQDPMATIRIKEDGMKTVPPFKVSGKVYIQPLHVYLIRTVTLGLQL